MVMCGNWPVGVCSWSLHNDLAVLSEAKDKLALEHINLALAPALEENGSEYLKAIKKQGWKISATMINFDHEDYSTLDTIKMTGGIRPDEHWEKDSALFLAAIDVTADLGVKYIAFHAGFLDHTDLEYAKKFHDRMKYLADAAAKKNVIILMETGQETAQELKMFLEEMKHPSLAVNFDPANMILYNKGVPADAVRTLGPWIRHIHIKDAIRTTTPGQWGAEVPWGDGQVDQDGFLAALKEVGFNGTMCVEREWGDQRLQDISLAVSRLSKA
jgi:sugar phosphate isomerase/epimerase